MIELLKRCSDLFFKIDFIYVYLQILDQDYFMINLAHHKNIDFLYRINIPTCRFS